MPWARKDCKLEGKGDFYEVIPLEAGPRLLPPPIIRELFNQAQAGFAQTRALPWAPSDDSCTFTLYPDGNIGFIAKAADPAGGDDFIWFKVVEKRHVHEGGTA